MDKVPDHVGQTRHMKRDLGKRQIVEFETFRIVPGLDMHKHNAGVMADFALNHTLLGIL